MAPLIAGESLSGWPTRCGDIPAIASRRNRGLAWFTHEQLHAQGVAPEDETYQYSRVWRRLHTDWFERGHLMPGPLAARLGEDAEHNGHSLLNAVPQRSTFNAGIWQELDYITGAWAQRFGKVWVVTGPVVIDGQPTGWIGEEGETPVAVMDTLFRVVIKESADPARPDLLAFPMPHLGPRHSKFRPYVPD